MNNLRKLFYFLLRVLVLFLFVVAAYLIISNKCQILNHDNLTIGASAFFGAFFVFVFARISFRLTAKIERYSKHFTALVKIERILNRTIAQLDKDLHLGQEDIKAISSMNLVIWNLPPIPCSHELADDLMNTDFLNDYFSFTEDIGTLNRDLGVIMAVYDESKRLFLGGVISPEHHKDNIALTIRQLSGIIMFIKSKEDEAIELLAKVRILLKEKKHRVLLFSARPDRHYDKNMIQQSREEIAVLKEEIKLTQQKSQEEIDKIKRAMV